MDPENSYISVHFCRKIRMAYGLPGHGIMWWRGLDVKFNYFLFSHTVFRIDFTLNSNSEGPFILAVDLIKSLVKTNIILLMVILIVSVKG